VFLFDGVLALTFTKI